MCFGYLASGRDAPLSGVRDVVGVLINMLVCRMEFDGSNTTADLLQSIQTEFTRALAHQNCSLADIQSSLGLQGQPLFNSVLSIQYMKAATKSQQPPETSFNTVYEFGSTEVRVPSG